ncbi:hypothetical protein [Streptomyces californicus]
MFQAGQEVLIVSCDEVPPGPLTNGRWTVHRVGPLIGPVLCHSHELRLA